MTRTCITATVAALPLKTYRELGDGSREEVQSSWVDQPCPWLPPFTFKQLLLTYLLTNGNAFLLHIEGGAGQIAPPDRSSGRLQPI